MAIPHLQEQDLDLVERVEELEIKLQEKIKAASEWAAKCMELTNQRLELKNKIEKLSKEIDEIKGYI